MINIEAIQAIRTEWNTINFDTEGLDGYGVTAYQLWLESRLANFIVAANKMQTAYASHEMAKLFADPLPPPSAYQPGILGECARLLAMYNSEELQNIMTRLHAEMEGTP